MIPTQAECRRCERLFCYFRKTNPRMYCSRCVRLERQDANEFNNLLARCRTLMTIKLRMRQSEAGLFDAKHSGQRGCDRADALFDAYVAIRAALSPVSSTQGGGK